MTSDCNSTFNSYSRSNSNSISNSILRLYSNSTSSSIIQKKFEISRSNYSNSASNNNPRSKVTQYQIRNWNSNRNSNSVIPDEISNSITYNNSRSNNDSTSNGNLKSNSNSGSKLRSWKRRSCLVEKLMTLMGLHRLLLIKYRKIPDISPGLVLFQRHFLGGLYPGTLITGGNFASDKRSK